MHKLTTRVFAVACSAAFGIVAAAAGLVAASATGQGEGGGPAQSTTLGQGTKLVYENCYEQVGAFLVPPADIGVELPPGFSYRTFNPAGMPDPAGTLGRLVVVGLDCDLGDERVTDVFINAVVLPPPGFTSTLLRIRGYTSLPQSATRFAQWCFGNVMPLGEVEATFELKVGAPGRLGRVFGTDGEGSIEMLTSTPGLVETDAAAATIRHFSVKAGEVHGLLEFSADAARQDRGGDGSGTLILDGGQAIAGLGQHVYPAP